MIEPGSGPLNSYVSRESKEKEPLKRVALESMPVPPSPVRAKPRAIRSRSCDSRFQPIASVREEKVALATHSVLFTAPVTTPPLPSQPPPSYWEQAKGWACEKVSGFVANKLGGINENDRAFFRQVTGDLKMELEIRKLCLLLPRANTDAKQKLQNNFVTRVVINLAKHVSANELGTMTTEQLISRMLQHIPLVLKTLFERVELNAQRNDRLVQREDFNGEGLWILKTIFDDLADWAHGLLRSLLFDPDQALYDIYVASHAIPLPEVPPYHPEILALARNIIHANLENLKKNYPRLTVWIDHWRGALEPLAVDVICRQISGFKERHPTNSFFEFAYFLADELNVPENQLATKIYTLFLSSIEDEIRIPKTFRKPLANYLQNSFLPEWVEKYQHHIENFVRAMHEEKKVLSEDPTKVQGVIGEVRALVDQYYVKVLSSLPNQFQPFIQPGYGKQFAFELLLQMLKHYSRSLSTPLTNLEEVINYGLSQMEIMLQTGDHQKDDPTARRKQFHVLSKTFLKRFFPGIHVFSDVPSNRMVDACERYWKLTTKEPLFPLTQRLYTLFPETTPVVDSFIVTYNLFLQRLMQAISIQIANPFYLIEGRPPLHINIPPFLVEKGHNMVQKFLLEGIVRGLERVNSKKAGHTLLDALFIDRVSSLIPLVPEESIASYGEYWIPFCQNLVQDLSSLFCHKADLARQVLPKLIASQNGTKVRRILLSLVRDVQIVQIQPLRRLGVDVNLSPFVEGIAEKALAQIPSRYQMDPLFGKLLINRILTHFLSRYADAKFNLDEPITYHRFLKSATTHLLDDFVTSYRGSGSFVLPVEQLLDLIVPSLRDYAPTINTYLTPFRLPPNDEEETRQRLRILLWDPACASAPGRVLSEYIGLEGTIDQFYAFADGVATFIIPLIEKQLKSVDKLNRIFSNHFSSAVIQDSLHPLFIGFLESPSPFMQSGKETFSTQVRRLIFKVIVNVMERENKPAQPRDHFLVAVVNRVITLVQTHSPALPDHKHKHPMAPPPITKGDMMPLVHELVHYFIPQPLLEIPLPHGFDQQIVNKLKDDLLPELCLDWYQKVVLFINEVPEHRGELNAIFNSNHVSVLAKVLGVWVQGFTIHMLGKNAETIASKAVVEVNGALHIALTEHTKTLLAAALTKLAESTKATSASEPESPMHTLSVFISRYAEAFFLKLWVPIFSHLKTVNDNLEEDEQGTIILALFQKFVPIISQYYQRINDIKLEIGETHAYRIPQSRLKSGLEGTLWDPPKPNILNGGYPISMPLVEGRFDEDVRNDHRLLFFTVLSRHLLYFAGINHLQPFPAPDPFVEKAREVLANEILPRTLLSLEKLVLSAENKDRLFLRFFEQIQNMADKLESRKSEDSPPPSPPSESQRRLNRIVGQLVRDLLLLIPHPYLAPFLHIEVLKNATDEKLGSIFFEQFSNLDFIQVIRDSIVISLPKIVPGKVEGLNKIDLKPLEEGAPLEADFNRPSSMTPDELNLLKKEILKKGAEALMRGFERLVVRKNFEAFLEHLKTKFSAMLNAHSGKSLEPFVDIFKRICTAIIQGFITILCALLNIPYQIVRWPVKEWYLKSLVADYLEELDSSYHEGIALDIVEAFFGEFPIPAT